MGGDTLGGGPRIGQLGSPAGDPTLNRLEDRRPGGADLIVGVTPAGCVGER